MEQFSLDEYLKNPTRPIVTRDGRSVRIICTDRNPDSYPVENQGLYSIIALVQGKFREDVMCYTENGLFLHCSEEPEDLFFATEREEKKNKHQGWVNIYEHDMNIRYPSFTIYNTEKEAKRERGNRCVATIKIEWEE